MPGGRLLASPAEVRTRGSLKSSGGMRDGVGRDRQGVRKAAQALPEGLGEEGYELLLLARRGREMDGRARQGQVHREKGQDRRRRLLLQGQRADVPRRLERQ